MMNLYRYVLTLCCSCLLASCGDSSRTTDWSDVGYGDGYAVGYNTTCKLRGTMVEGKWDNEEYMEAYNYGYADGAADCRKSK
jgi:hypothetical protein